MESLVPVVRRHVEHTYHDHPELVDPIFDFFQAHADSEYLMRDVAAATNVRITTVHSWRE
jgi:hypothetical protein